MLAITIMTLGLLAAVSMAVGAACDWWGMNYTDRGCIGVTLVVFVLFGGLTSVVWGIYHFWAWVL